MSFGVSVSDIFATTQLAYRTFTALRDAPSEFASLRLEVLSLHTTLKSLSEEASPTPLANPPPYSKAIPPAPSVSILTYCSDEKKEALRMLLEHCAKGLTQLERLAKGCKSLGDGEKRKFIERIEFAARNKGGSASQTPRERLALHTNCLNVFLTGLTHSTLGRLEGLWRQNMVPMMERVEGGFGVMKDLQVQHHAQIITRLPVNDFSHRSFDYSDEESAFHAARTRRSPEFDASYRSAQRQSGKSSFSDSWTNIGASLQRWGITKEDVEHFENDICAFIEDRVAMAKSEDGCSPYIRKMDSRTGELLKPLDRPPLWKWIKEGQGYLKLFEAIETPEDADSWGQTAPNLVENDAELEASESPYVRNRNRMAKTATEETGHDSNSDSDAGLFAIPLKASKAEKPTERPSLALGSPANDSTGQFVSGNDKEFQRPELPPDPEKPMLTKVNKLGRKKKKGCASGDADIAAVGDVASYAAHNSDRDENGNRTQDISRSRSRRRDSSSSGRRGSSDFSHASNSENRRERSRRTDRVLAAAAVAGAVERIRSRSRSRTRSTRRRRALPIAQAGLGGAAIAGLVERHKVMKDDSGLVQKSDHRPASTSIETDLDKYFPALTLDKPSSLILGDNEDSDAGHASSSASSRMNTTGPLEVPGDPSVMRTESPPLAPIELTPCPTCPRSFRNLDAHAPTCPGKIIGTVPISKDQPNDHSQIPHSRNHDSISRSRTRSWSRRRNGSRSREWSEAPSSSPGEDYYYLRRLPTMGAVASEHNESYRRTGTQDKQNKKGLAEVICEEEARIERSMRNVDAAQDGGKEIDRVDDLMALFESAFEVDDAVLIGEAAMGALN